ncbi:MAG TPA: hypothetical protein VGR79_02355 [Stellaceae bacterium]|nr:hypothetical protein [Stellaceae bacterium]
MQYTFARAVLASAIALGTLVFSAGSAVPGKYNQYQSAYPSYAGQVTPVVVPDGSRNSRTIVIVQQSPQLLTPADLRFSVEKEGDVTIVRGPIAR